MVIVYLKEELPKGNKKVIRREREGIGCTFIKVQLKKQTKGKKKTMPKINQKLSEPQKDIIESETYIIQSAEDVTTDKSKWEAIKVVLKSTNPKDENEYATMLWQSDTIPSNSKLGSFIDAFNVFLKDENAGYDTDNWINHKIRVKTWRNKNREIEVIS